MHKLLVSTLCTLLVLAACRKTEFDSEVNNPVFFTGISLQNGDTLGYTAGIDGIYHFTFIEKELDKWRSINGFSATDCPKSDCPNSLRFEFLMNDTVDPSNWHSLPFAAPDSSSQPTSYLVNFKWDDSISFTEQRLYINGILLAENGSGAVLNVNSSVSEVLFIHRNNSGYQSQVSRLINWNDPGAMPVVSLNIEPDTSGGYFLHAFVSDTVGVQLYWSTGQKDETTIYLDSLFSWHSFSVVRQGITIASAALFDIPHGLNQSIGTKSFTFNVTPSFEPPPSAVAIQYIDENNVVWRSDYEEQPATFPAHFNIYTNEPYEDNENGVPTRKLWVDFQCTVFNKDGERKTFVGYSSTAVALKE
ncbi:MAG: hypothetical protein JNJ57_17035 [Saprospiraceae bacterium]|nr:hypothetical protein [Saprospiraceae bacterium]